MFERILVEADEMGLMRAAARSVAPGARIEEIRKEKGKPGDVLDGVLVQAGEMDADLLITGSGSRVLARRLAMLAPCSVMVLPEGWRLDLKRIMVAVDFSVQSADAVRMASALAARSGGLCQVVAVECADDPWLEWVEDKRRADENLAAFVEKAALDGSRVTWGIERVVHSSVSIGEEFLALPHAIEGADIAATITMAAVRDGAGLLVMGTRGRSRAASILIGSVTEKAIQLAESPVLAVKQHGTRLSLMEGILERLRTPQPKIAVN